MMSAHHVDAIVIGGGPAGLRAAQILVEAGIHTSLFDAKPSVGRKFLVAGRGGLNLTHSEPLDLFATRYRPATSMWQQWLQTWGPDQLRKWALDLGIETYVGSSRRVFPVENKSATLLRRWIQSLRKSGLTLHMRHEWNEWTPGTPHTLKFSTPDGIKTYSCKTLILALGGVSWPQTGSNGNWTKIFNQLQIPLSPWAPANVGFQVNWSPDFLKLMEGQPIKNCRVSYDQHSLPGEVVITHYGIEGTPIYHLTPYLREASQPVIYLDLKPESSIDSLLKRYKPKTGISIRRRAAKCWNLSPIISALIHANPPTYDLASPHIENPEDLAKWIKHYPLPLKGAQPIAEAISSAGGVPWAALDSTLKLKSQPNTFLAGEMIDWEAPTGGYLLQGCFTTATIAGLAAAQTNRDQ